MADIDYRIEGLDAVLIGIRAASASLREELQDILQEAARLAETEMTTNAPYHSGELAMDIEIEPIRFSPGGIGGGGFWETTVTVGEHTPYLRFLLEGTGVHGQKGVAYGPRVRSFMKFNGSWDGKTIYATKIRGQRPQTEWIDTAQEATDEFIAARLREIDLNE